MKIASKLALIAFASVFALTACSDSNSQSTSTQNAQAKHIELYQSPACGCCGKWVQYMQNKGYSVNVHKDSDYYSYKQQRFGVKDEYESCHTGLIDGYVLEGHLPEDAVAWLLSERPSDAIGISTPGMPMGSPGMEQGGEDEEYKVIVLQKDGGYRVYGTYKGHELIKKD